DTLDAKVPPMLIQPLIENAIVHGLKAGGSVSVWLRARRTPDGVELTVSDDGPGFVEGSPVRGHGLDLVESLLEQGLNGGGSIEYHDREGGGAEVTVTLRDGAA